MIDAEIKGKLPEIHHLEDALTSCYFGLMKYCSINILNRYFLSALKDLDDQQFKCSLDIAASNLNFKIYFWLRLNDNSEPDLVILLYDKSYIVKYLFFVEVKYYSQQNVYETNDDFESNFHANQLSREYTNLFSVIKVDNFVLRSETKRFLIYLTADYSSPNEDFNKALNELKKSFDIQQICKNILWVNWYNLYDILEEKGNVKLTLDFEIKIIEDLKKYLYIKNFWSFKGFKDFDEVKEYVNFFFLQDENETIFVWQFEKITLFGGFFGGA